MNSRVILGALFVVTVVVLHAQEPRPRVFITDSQSWSIGGGFGSSSSAGGGAVRGGASPQTAEIIKTVGEKCKEVIVTARQENADYILLLEHEGGKGLVRKDNKFALDGYLLDSGYPHI
ncbi:MAG: hypothetical protein HYX74_06040 [Acidobacteria bacterium]|nr:hypothetical protein [Acidobacteriota bacterium]